MSRLFATPSHPYYVYAPPYRQDSGGVRALHYLCHALNLAGQEAYVVQRPTHPELVTPTLSTSVVATHQDAGRTPIAIYPEVVSGNPLGSDNVVRWLLALPGLYTGGSLELGPRDLVFALSPNIVPRGLHAELLRLPLVDTRIFNAPSPDSASRSGTAVFINRYLDKGGQLDPLTADSIEISYRVAPRDAEELAALLRSVELLYLYEHSTIASESLLCGCPVVYLPNPIFLAERVIPILGGNGVAWGASPEAIVRAKATVPLAAAVYAREEGAFWGQLEHFVATTQVWAR